MTPTAALSGGAWSGNGRNDSGGSGVADKPDITDLEREADRLYEAWRESRDYEDWLKYLAVKKQLDLEKGLTEQ